MAYSFEPQPDEKVLLDLDYRRRSKYEQSLRLVVTDKALFVPAGKFMISGDPHYLKRVPVEEAPQVQVQNLKPYLAYAIAPLMVVAGLYALYSLALPGAYLSPKGLGYGAAIVIGGCLVPFAAKGRRRLVVKMADGKFVWNAPTHVDRQSKEQMNVMLNQLVAACGAANIATTDERMAA